MELDERKIKILNAIIQTYLETGEPVGSRTISRFTDLKLSSALYSHIHQQDVFLLIRAIVSMLTI